eukprot:gene10218-13747_t
MFLYLGLKFVVLSIAVLLLRIDVVSTAFVGTTITPTPDLSTDVSPYYILDALTPIIGGLYSNLKQANTPSNTLANKNIAILFASRRVINSLVPGNSFLIDNYLYNAGIDPNAADFNDHLTDVDSSSPYGIGNLAGIAVVNSLESDASNQLGKLNNHAFNLPNLLSDGNGVITFQSHVAPQIFLVTPISVDANDKIFKSAKSTPRSVNSVKDEYMKLQAEFYNNKALSYLPALKFIGTNRNLALDDYVFSSFTISVAVYDAAIIVWKNKIKQNSVRPFTAARYIYGDNVIPAAYVVGKGQLINQVTGNDWKSYVNVAPHADYPSGSAVYFSAFATAAKLYFGDDVFGFLKTYAVGTSSVEPGVTPASATTILASTFTQYEADGGYARVLGGVHFTEDVIEAQRIGRLVAPIAYAKTQSLIKGTAAPTVTPTTLSPTRKPTRKPDNEYIV